MNLWDVIRAAGDVSSVTKDLFGKLVHSDNQKDVDRAMKALESAGGYEHLADTVGAKDKSDPLVRTSNTPYHRIIRGIKED